jgi:hypothetical protein
MFDGNILIRSGFEFATTTDLLHVPCRGYPNEVNIDVLFFEQLPHHERGVPGSILEALL